MANTGKNLRAAVAKMKVAEGLKETLTAMGAVEAGGVMAVPVTDGAGVVTYVTVTLTAKNDATYATAKGEVKEAFDPAAVQAEYENELARKAAEKEAKAAAAKPKKSAKG